MIGSEKEKDLHGLGSLAEPSGVDAWVAAEAAWLLCATY